MALFHGICVNLHDLNIQFVYVIRASYLFTHNVRSITPGRWILIQATNVRKWDQHVNGLDAPYGNIANFGPSTHIDLHSLRFVTALLGTRYPITGERMDELWKPLMYSKWWLIILSSLWTKSSNCGWYHNSMDETVWLVLKTLLLLNEQSVMGSSENLPNLIDVMVGLSQLNPSWPIIGDFLYLVFLQWKNKSPFDKWFPMPPTYLHGCHESMANITRLSQSFTNVGKAYFSSATLNTSWHTLDYLVT